MCCEVRALEGSRLGRDPINERAELSAGSAFSPSDELEVSSLRNRGRRSRFVLVKFL